MAFSKIVREERPWYPQQNSPWFTTDQNQALVQTTPQPSGNLELPKPVSWRTNLGIASCKFCKFQGCCFLSIHTLWEAVSKLSSKAGGKAKAECTAGAGRNTWQCWENIPWTPQGIDSPGIEQNLVSAVQAHQSHIESSEESWVLPMAAWESSTHTHTHS